MFLRSKGWTLTYSRFLRRRTNIFVTLYFLLLLVLTELGFWCWLRSGNEKVQEFGSHFAAEMIGVFVAVYIIDRLVEKREEARRAPVRLVAYQETSVVYNRFVGIFLDLYSNTFPEPTPALVAAFISEKHYIWALYLADAYAPANVLPAKLVHESVVDQARRIRDSVEKIIGKYGAVMDPKVVSLLYALFLDSSVIARLLTLSSLLEPQKAFPYPQVLDYHLGELTTQELRELLTLEKWLSRERQALLKQYAAVRPLVVSGQASQPSPASYPYRLEEALRQAQ